MSEIPLDKLSPETRARIAAEIAAAERVVDSFTGSYDFLDNDFPVPIELLGEVYPSVSHAFAAARSEDAVWRERVRRMSAAEARYVSANIKPREGWSSKPGVSMRDEAMLGFLHQKFAVGSDLRKRLEPLKSARIIYRSEADLYWGVDAKGLGDNRLGEALMYVRDNPLRAEFRFRLKPDDPGLYDYRNDVVNFFPAVLKGAAQSMEACLHAAGTDTSGFESFVQAVVTEMTEAYYKPERDSGGWVGFQSKLLDSGKDPDMICAYMYSVGVIMCDFYQASVRQRRGDPGADPAELFKFAAQITAESALPKGAEELLRKELGPGKSILFSRVGSVTLEKIKPYVKGKTD